MACVECKAASAPYRYKCCGRAFCSVSCYKSHSCASASSPRAPDEEVAPITHSEPEGAVLLSAAQVAALQRDAKLRSMLSNNVLRRVLRSVCAASDPLSAMSPYMTDEFFAGFVTQVLETLSTVDEPAAGRRGK